MSDYQEKYFKLKNSIHKVQQITEVDSGMLYEDLYDQAMVYIQKQGVRELSEFLFNEGMLEFSELQPSKEDEYLYLDMKKFRTSLWVADPKSVDVHKKELESARVSGRNEVCDEITKAAQFFLNGTDYGPMIGRNIMDEVKVARRTTEELG